MRTERFPWATAAGPSLTAPPTTTVPVRSLMTTRALVSTSTGNDSRRATRSGTACRYCGGTRMVTLAASVAFAISAPSSALTASATRPALVKSGSVSEKTMESEVAICTGVPSCTSVPFGTRPDRQMVHLHVVAAAATAKASNRERALRQSPDLTVGAAQRGRQQDAALETPGIAHRGRRGVHARAGAREGREIGRHQHGGDVLHLDGLGIHGDAKALQHRCERLR